MRLSSTPLHRHVSPSRSWTITRIHHADAHSNSKLAQSLRQNLIELSLSDLRVDNMKRKACQNTVQSLIRVLQPEVLPELRCITSPSFCEENDDDLEDAYQAAQAVKVVLEGGEDHWCARLTCVASIV